MPPLGLQIMSMAGAIIIMLVFGVYFVMPLYYEFSEQGDKVAATFNINTTQSFNNTKEIYPESTFDDHFFVVGLSFGLLAALFIYFNYHNDNKRKRMVVRAVPR